MLWFLAIWLVLMWVSGVVRRTPSTSPSLPMGQPVARAASEADSGALADWLLIGVGFIGLLWWLLG